MLTNLVVFATNCVKKDRIILLLQLFALSLQHESNRTDHPAN